MPTDRGDVHEASGDLGSVHGLKKQAYKDTLRRLQIELVKAQRHLIGHGHRVLVIFEGRDAAGKDGTIKRVVEHLSPRETRVVALGRPSDHEQAEWYFQRHVSHLPAAGEFVLFTPAGTTARASST